MLTRRTFCISMSAGLAGSVLARPAVGLLRQDEVELDVKELRPGHWAIVGQGGNSLLVRTDEGPVLIDTKVARAGDALRRGVVRTAGLGPALVINTHHHADHVGGNYAFSKSAKIVAHVNVRPRLEGMIKGRISRALGERGKTLTVDDFDADREISDELDLEHGDVTMKLRHYGFGHTDNDVVIFLPDANMLHMGDLVFHELHPYIDVSARATTTGWQHSLAEAQKLCDEKTIVIPGHGAITDRTGLARMSDYFDQLREIVRTAIAEGRTRDEIITMTPEAFAGRGFERMQPIALGVMYDELKAD